MGLGPILHGGGASAFSDRETREVDHAVFRVTVHAPESALPAIVGGCMRRLEELRSDIGAISTQEATIKRIISAKAGLTDVDAVLGDQSTSAGGSAVTDFGR